jgi:hypothetical protein
MAGRFDPTIDRLIDQQSSFISGIDPSKISSTTVPLTSAFRPTLDEGLRTGFRADTGAAKAGARAAAGVEQERAFQGIDERLAAKGLTGSSAQTGQLSRASTDLATLLGEKLANIDLQADVEAGRGRQAALGSALGEASASQAQQGLDINRASLGLQSRAQQAGAGQNLIDALLRNNPNLDLSNRFSSVGGAPQPGSRPGVSDPFMRDLLRNRELMQNQAMAKALNAGRDTGGFDFTKMGGLRPIFDTGSIVGRNFLEEDLRHNTNLRREDLVNDLGPAGAAQVLATATGAAGSMFTGANASTAALTGQSIQNDFMNDLAERFAPNLVTGGA